jgi:ribonuclease-3
MRAKKKAPPEAGDSGTRPPTLAELESHLGYVFRNKDLLKTALTHPSAAYEGAKCETNQRLEFLGDAVLQLVLTRELYQRFTAQEEGPLTKARAKLVNSRTLAEQARGLKLGEHLIIGHGEEMQGGRDRQSSLGDAFEAVLGAMFLDSNFQTVQAVVLRMFSGAFNDLSVLPVIENPKGELQEFLQAGSPEGPIYTVQSASGPDHDRVFVCTVQHLGVELGIGKGKSKKTAESAAAAAALGKLRQAAGPKE